MSYSDFVSFDEIEEKVNNLSEKEFEELAQEAGFDVYEEKEEQSFKDTLEMSFETKDKSEFHDQKVSFDYDMTQRVKLAA